jgi:hypothetical protein
MVVLLRWVGVSKTVRAEDAVPVVERQSIQKVPIDANNRNEVPI